MLGWYYEEDLVKKHDYVDVGFEPGYQYSVGKLFDLGPPRYMYTQQTRGVCPI